MRNGISTARLCFFICSLILHGTCWPQDRSASQFKEPFASWIDTAPPGIKRLIDIGQVTFETDDLELTQRNKQGLTLFRFDYRYRYRFSTSIAKPQDGSDIPRILVSASIFVSDITWSHRVIVGSNFKPELPGRSRLLQHEFDHVSISTDPRLKVLLQLTLGAAMRFEIPEHEIPPRENQTLAQRIDDQIASRMKERVLEIERVTQSFNDRFDKESNSGSQTITKRDALFCDFFSTDSLSKLDFQFHEIFRQYDKSISKAPWQEHYLLNTPP
jgi:hypothetical protein